MLTGPRQCGKTTLAREISQRGVGQLLRPGRSSEPRPPGGAEDRARAARGLVVIDEVQRRPDLFPVLRVLADRGPSPARFLILGSASGDLLRQSRRAWPAAWSGSHRWVLLAELGADSATKLWRRGGFPRCLSRARPKPTASPGASQFIQTLLERDLPQWGVRVPAVALARFWTMVAHYHGQTWNAAEPARALGVNETTSRRYLDLLTDAYMVRQLQPWHANLGKRQVKSPKVYVRDSGLLHQLLGIETEKALLSHPKVGASWEGFVVEQVLASRAARRGLVLGHASGRRDRPPAAPGRPAVRRGVQARRCAADDAVDPHRARRSGAGARGHGLSRGAAGIPSPTESRRCPCASSPARPRCSASDTGRAGAEPAAPPAPGAGSPQARPLPGRRLRTAREASAVASPIVAGRRGSRRRRRRDSAPPCGRASRRPAPRGHGSAARAPARCRPPRSRRRTPMRNARTETKWRWAWRPSVPRERPPPRDRDGRGGSRISAGG